MKILYIGASSGTSLARFEALKALGHEARIIDPYRALPRSRLARAWAFRTGALGLAGLVARSVLAQAAGAYDLVFVDNGELVGPALLRRLRALAPRIVNYNQDNPYVARDGDRWRLFLKALPGYDRVFVPRESCVPAALAHGARHAERVWFAADDSLIEPANHPDEAERAPFRSPVSFTGTWMPERGPFLLELIERGVPLRIFGPRWEKAPEYGRLREHVVPGALSTRRYEAAVAAADISIALLSKGNEDLHTTRSLEIPVLGSLLCGERTADHRALYAEGEEALFFDDAAECARHCLTILADPARLATMREAGRRRAIANGHFNRSLMQRMIEAAT